MHEIRCCVQKPISHTVLYVKKMALPWKTTVTKHRHAAPSFSPGRFQATQYDTPWSKEESDIKSETSKLSIQIGATDQEEEE
jgi:hypothetical protein